MLEPEAPIRVTLRGSYPSCQRYCFFTPPGPFSAGEASMWLPGPFSDLWGPALIFPEKDVNDLPTEDRIIDTCLY